MFFKCFVKNILVLSHTKFFLCKFIAMIWYRQMASQFYNEIYSLWWTDLWLYSNVMQIRLHKMHLFSETVEFITIATYRSYTHRDLVHILVHDPYIYPLVTRINSQSRCLLLCLQELQIRKCKFDCFVTMLTNVLIGYINTACKV